MLNEAEIKAILTLIGRATLKGNEAMPVAHLQKKLQGMITNTPMEEEKKDTVTPEEEETTEEEEVAEEEEEEVV